MASSKRSLRIGFTLVELLVVILILGMLFSTLLLSVGGTRESNRRSVCIYQMNKLTLASLQFETAKERFPGYLEQPIPKHNREFPWLVSLMPYLERDDIHDSWMNIKSEPFRVYVRFLRCPSDPATMVRSDSNSYVCNTGLIINKMIGSNTIYEDNNLRTNGIFLDLRRHRENPQFMRAKDLYDGVSNTLLIAENLLAGGWGDANPVVASGQPESKVKLTSAFCWFDTKAPSADMRINGNFKTAKKLTPELLRPSSNHPGGVNVAFADGHTMFLRESIAYHVYVQLMTPNHKESSCSYKSYVLRDEDYE